MSRFTSEPQSFGPGVFVSEVCGRGTGGPSLSMSAYYNANNAAPPLPPEVHVQIYLDFVRLQRSKLA